MLNQIFVNEPNLRINLDGIKKHRFFLSNKPNDYWQKIANKSFQEVPYKPNPLKYQYLLQNKYKLISNLGKKVQGSETDSDVKEDEDENHEDDNVPNFGGPPPKPNQNQNAT